MAKRFRYDRPLFAVTLLLLAFGLVMVFSASAVVAMERYHSPAAFLLRQLVGAGIGLTLGWGLMHLDYRKLKDPRIVYSVVFSSMLLLVIPFFLPGAHNTHRWIRLGPLSLQPSELAKPALILFAAFFLERRARTINDLMTLKPLGIYMLFVCALVYKEPDLGTTVALVLIATAMCFSGGMRLRYFAYAGIAALLPLYWAIFHVGYRLRRMSAFLHPWAEAQGNGFQLVQSLISVGTGGISGLGLMNGKQKLFFLPEPQTDFIFAVVNEELGLLGGIFVVSCFMVFLHRGLRIARSAPDAFGRLLAVGITCMIVVQALINFSVVTGLMPTKGIPLPFISYGSSSLIVSLASVGVLLNISQHAN